MASHRFDNLEDRERAWLAAARRRARRRTVVLLLVLVVVLAAAAFAVTVELVDVELLS